MESAERWLLPDGIEELLPAQAARVEALRRQLLDLFQRWGYELLVPPLVEYTESLLMTASTKKGWFCSGRVFLAAEVLRRGCSYFACTTAT